MVSRLPHCLRTPHAARLIGVQPRTLEKWRCDGSGPPFRKLNRIVVYAVEDLRSWIDERVWRSTRQTMVSHRGAPR